jgi:hypothetical protein
MALRSKSAADFPYDERLQAGDLRGLERLRAIPDRTLAEYLYKLHGLAERNETPPPEGPARAPVRLGDLRHVASRALGGELGPEVRELATYLLLDESGRERRDQASLRNFGDALRDLRRAQR